MYILPTHGHTTNTLTLGITRSYLPTPLLTASRSTSPAQFGPGSSTTAGGAFLTACVFRRGLRLAAGGLHAATQRPRSSSISTRHAWHSRSVNASFVRVRVLAVRAAAGGRRRLKWRSFEAR